MATETTYEDNLEAAETHLQRFSAAPLPHLIAGQASPSLSGETFSNYSPIDGRHLGDVASGDAADIDAAANAAVEGFGVWSAMPGTERKRVLHRLADLIEENAHQIAVTECVDTGQTMRFMGHAALRGAANFRFFADQAPGASDGQSLPTADHLNYTVRNPIGPVGGHHTMEHALHAQHMEDRTCTRCGVQRGAQACRVEPVHRAPTG